ncbi:OCRE domain-containing protein [Floccifex sp.]|uniref:OCRE domain-containing protein n=1 Tax=Floccifex sp. TaxID=2815810 RepID=UPI003F0384E1
MNKSKRKKRSFSLKSITILCAILFMFFSFLLYCISDDSKTHVLACEGNYFYTDAQIYEKAHVSLNTRLYLMPGFLMENQVKNLDLIESVNVTKKENSIVIHIKEKMAVGYYIEDSKYYILTIDNESIELDSQYKSNLIHLPLISDLSKSQRKSLCEELKKVEDDITYELIEKISQIVPFSSSYDENMIRLIMRDGNSIYSSFDSLSMLTKYSLVLTQLKGTSACLLLDLEHNAIDKISCTDITTNRKELQTQIDACQEDGKTWDYDSSSCVETEEENKEETIEKEPNQDLSYLDSIQDWQYDANSGWYYSESTGYYYSQFSNEYFEWDDASASFVKIEEP